MTKSIKKSEDLLMVTNPIFLVFLVSIFNYFKKWKIKLIVHDVFPDNLALIKSNSLIINIFLPVMRFTFNYSYSKMDKIIVLGRDMFEIFEKKISKKNNKLVIIENWSDTDNIKPEINLLDYYKFLFAGNIGKVQGIDILLNAIQKSNNINFTFSFIGNGALANQVKKMVESNPAKFQYSNWIDRESQSNFLNQCDIGVVSLHAGMKGLGVPSKVYNLLAAGKPIFYIGDIGSEIELLIRDYNIGFFAEAGNEKNICITIEKIINTSKTEMIKMSNNARSLALSNYQKTFILNKYQALFSE